MRLKPLRQQIIVITGASSGIGLSTARMAAERGARVVMASRNEDVLQRLAQAINDAGGTASYKATDVGDESQVRALAEYAIERYGGFDTWVNNAGVAIFGRAEDISLDDHKRLFDTNYWGMVHGMHAALPHLRQRGGALINIGSILSDCSIPLQAPYNASKHAIKAYTDTVRIELEQEKAPVSVTLIKPNSIATPLQDHAKSYLPAHPRVPPPAYDPRVAARAVLYAAEHPIRDLVVGDSGPFVGFATALAPGVVDQMMGASMFRLQKGPNPSSTSADNLGNPGADGEERTRYPLVLGDSLYTRFATSNPARVAATVARGVTGTAAAIGSRLAASAMEWMLDDRGNRTSRPRLGKRPPSSRWPH